MSFENKPYHLLMASGTDTVVRLREAFNAARFGHYFRTLTMLNTNTLNHEWLYAVQDPLSHRCTLMKVQENPTSNQEQRSVVGENMTFMDALERMARFDSLAANPSMVMVPSITNQQITLELTHYRMFANREGLAFDNHTHSFHPTMNGHIITAGLFDKDELVRINKFAETKRRTTDPFPVPAPQIMREGINDSTDQLLALFNDHEQLNHMLTFYKALHKIEQFLVDRNQNTFSVYSLDTALIDANFINDTKNAFENPWRIDKARIKISGDPHEGRQSAFFYTAILQRLHAIKPDHPELRAHHQKALRDHEFCFEFALARRNTIKIMQYDAKISEKKEAAAFLKNRLATLDKMAAKRGISPEGIAGLHAVVYGGKLPSVFDETAAFLELLNKAKQALQDDIRTKQRRLQTLIP